MQVVITKNPPNIEDIEKVFDLKGKKPIFAYGDVIYNPHKGTITNDLLIHEGVHQRRQGDDPKGWWVKYLKDIDFRRMEELEAYSYQYQFFCSQNKDRNKRTMFLHRISKDLASSMYGNIISYGQAMKTLRECNKDYI